MGWGDPGPIALHWNGTAIAKVDTTGPDGGVSNGEYAAVWVDSDFAWVVGDPNTITSVARCTAAGCAITYAKTDVDTSFWAVVGTPETLLVAGEVAQSDTAEDCQRPEGKTCIPANTSCSRTRFNAATSLGNAVVLGGLGGICTRPQLSGTWVSNGCGTPTEYIRGVWLGPAGGYAVGTEGIFSFSTSGGSCTLVDDFDPAGMNFAAVFGTADNNVWAVGDSGLVMHFDGTEWQRVPLGDQFSLTGVWATATEVWVVGQRDSAQPAMLRYKP
ncbi:MAG: hypothetical protein QM765_06430 [Myxococcales bacterium]